MALDFVGRAVFTTRKLEVDLYSNLVSGDQVEFMLGHLTDKRDVLAICTLDTTS